MAMFRTSSRPAGVTSKAPPWRVDQAIGHGPGRKLVELAGEVVVERDAEPCVERLRFDAEVAHQLGDERPSEPIVGVEQVPAFHGEPASFQVGVVRGELLRVLHERARDVTDGRDAETDHIGRRLGGVAHEVAMEPPRRRRTGELVVRQREVIHADLHVAGRQEPVHHFSEQLQLALPRRQRCGVDPLLVAADPRHVRVRIRGHAIRPHRHDGVDRAAERVACLQRQPVNQVDVDRVEPEPAGIVEEAVRERLGLNAIDGFLHFGSEVLHAERYPVEAKLPQQPPAAAGW